MSDPVVVALVAGVVALTVAYINTFVSESYKRFRDGSTVAASLCGELAAYEEAWPILSSRLDILIEACKTAKPPLDTLRPIERPKDLVYEKSIDKLGLLGASTAERVVYVYSNINAFRIAFELVARDHAAMSAEELSGRCIVCRDTLLRAATAGEVLIGVLRTRAAASFKPEWPWTPWFHRS